MDWKVGRYGLYSKAILFAISWLTISLLKLKDFNYVRVHVDEYRDGKTHYQLVIRYKKTGVGATFLGDHIFNVSDIIVLYMPEKQVHGIDRVESGEAHSIGWRV